VGGDIIGRIYEYFLNKFAKNIAQDDGVFFTPKSLVKMIVNVLEPSGGVLLDPACGSGGMFVQTGDFVEHAGLEANSAMTFYGQEKVEYNAQLCLMNMAVHGLTGVIKSGDEANTFYHDAHNLDGCCDYVMANPPFNVDKVNSESAQSAGRLPFGLPSINAKKEFGNANYLWISYFYSYLNEKGRAGFVMASSATDSSGKDRDIRQKLVETGHVDVMVSVGNNFFYTKSLPCSLWFFDRGKSENLQDKVLFLDARNYYTVVDRTLNEWSEWQLKNLNSIVWLYRGETKKYQSLLQEYHAVLGELSFSDRVEQLTSELANCRAEAKEKVAQADKRSKKKVQAEYDDRISALEQTLTVAKEALWLYEKFGEGEYQDIPGLCKIASRSEIAEKNYSLTPGAYVGVAAAEDDGVDFAQRMAEIHKELLKLQAESNELMATISKNMKEMGL
jgi:type I restriction enzyme M protein